MKLDTLDGWERTHLSTEIGEKDVDSQVLVMGWILRRRDHGGVIFVDLRDRRGLVQLVFNPQHSEEAHGKAHELRPEWVVAARGVVRLRPDDSINPNLHTGRIEVFVEEVKLLNSSEPPPFPLDEEDPPTDAVRYRYRYLDLRRPGGARKGVMARHRFNSLVRAFLNQEDFVEIETPFLTTSTPEGARDYLVPSRVSPGSLRAAPVPTDLQAIAHGRGVRAVLPDSPLLPETKTFAQTANPNGWPRCAGPGSASSEATPHAVGDGTEEQQDDGGYRQGPLNSGSKPIAKAITAISNRASAVNTSASLRPRGCEVE